MNFGQLIEYFKINIFLKKLYRKEVGKLVPDHFLLFKKALYQLKASGLQLDFTIFQQSSYQDSIKTNCSKLYITDLEICSILVFQIRLWEQLLQHIVSMIFQQKCSSCYILLTNQISLAGCLYFLRYWEISVLPLLVNQVVASWILKLNELIEIKVLTKT